MSEIEKGSTDQTLYFKLVDDTTGSAKSGLVVSAIDATYIRTRRVAVKGDVSAVAASADSAHVDNQGFEVDATNAPGLYRIDFVDAAFANSSDVPQVICVINHVSCDPAMQAVDLVTKRSGELGIDIITSSVIAANAITAAKFAGGAINASAIAADAITSAKFAANAINASAVSSSTVVTTGAFSTGQGPRIRKNAALSNFAFVMTDAKTHAPTAGLTVTATRRIDSGTFAAAANAVTSVASGWYTIDFDATDLNGDVIAVRFTATGADDLPVTIVTNP